MAAKRLGEQFSRLDVLAHVVEHGGKHLVVGLLFEDHECGHDREARVDHRRELAREDLEGTSA